MSRRRKRHERDDVGRVLRPVQHPGAALVELLAAIPASEPAVAPGRALRPLRDGGRSAAHTPHPLFPRPRRPRLPGTDVPRRIRTVGASADRSLLAGLELEREGAAALAQDGPFAVILLTARDDRRIRRRG